MGLFDSGNLAGMKAADNIEMNARAMATGGVPRAVVSAMVEEAKKHVGTLAR